MKLLPLGCLAGMPSAGQASSGYLVKHDDRTIMLDAGPGTAVALSDALGGEQLDAVFISHEHTDHIFDLLPIGKIVLTSRLVQDRDSGELSLDESVPRVPLFIPRGTASKLRTLAALFPVATHPLLDQAFELGFEVHEYEPEESFALGDLTLRPALLRHTAPNCGIRIEAPDGSSLVYTGDTGVTDALPALAEGAGTLLSESTLRESDTSDHGHLSSADAGRAARDAGVEELILTHFSSSDPVEHAWHRARASAEYDGPVHTARPHRSFTIATSRKAFA